MITGDVIVERWRQIPGYEAYEVSDAGRVVSLNYRRTGRPGLLKQSALSKKPGHNHRKVGLADGVKFREFLVHNLVLLAFIGPRPEGLPDTRHLNGDATDNRLENLRYGTRTQNIEDSIRHGNHQQAKKTHCPKNHPYGGLNLIQGPGYRRCRTCTKKKNAEYYQRKMARNRQEKPA